MVLEIPLDKTGGYFQFRGTLDPIAVVVRSPGGVYALDMESKHVSFDQLTQAVPELAIFLKQ